MTDAATNKATPSVLDDDSLAFYLNPQTQKLVPVKVIGRFKSWSERAGQYRIQMLTTGLSAIADRADLLTGWEADLSDRFWADPENWSTWKYGLMPFREEAAEKGVDGNAVFYEGEVGYAVDYPGDDGLTDRDVADLAEEWLEDWEDWETEPTVEQLELFPILELVGLPV